MDSQTCIKTSPLGQRKIVVLGRWPFERGSIHVKFSMTGQEKGDILIHVIS
jgi:hypothetical protein